MFEYELEELEEYIDFNILYNNLMSKNTTNIDTTTYSTKREDVITELMMDNFDLKINKDSRFVEKGRKIVFL